MNAPFYIGQEVVAIENHSQGRYKKGDHFRVLGLKLNRCCNHWVIDVGIKTNHSIMECICRVWFTDLSGIAWFSHEAFAPVQYNDTMTFEEAIQFVSRKCPQEV